MDGYARVIVAVGFLIIYTLVRTVRPIAFEVTLRRQAEIVAEATVIGVLVAATGFFESPIAFSLLTAVSVAGFVSGFGVSLRLATATTTAIAIPYVADGTSLQDDLRLTAQWAVELFLVSVVAAFARRIIGDADERHNRALDRMGRLADANELLFSLHQAAQDLPASLDLDEVLDSTIERLSDLVDFDTAAILLLEESDGSWSVARRRGTRLPHHYDAATLPPAVRLAAREPRIITEANLLRSGGPGLAPTASSGAYIGLRARGFLVGVLVVERADPSPFDERAIELLAGYAEPAALAIDNARWFSRLRTVGADEERTRIARDLHDRIGQSLAYLAFELDRIVRKDDRGDAVSEDLTGLREDVRGVVREVRDTLYDLRTEITADRPVTVVLDEFARRVRDRSGMSVDLHVEDRIRLPLPQERELWRIVQEAMVNAERHSGGSRIDVVWRVDEDRALAEVRDDGHGLPSGSAGRIDSYGMLGMRERAASIGAALEIDSLPQRGVTVRVRLRPGTT